MYRVLFGPIRTSDTVTCGSGYSNADQWMTWNTCHIDVHVFQALYVIVIVCCIILCVQTLYCIYTYVQHICSRQWRYKPFSAVKKLQLLLVCMQCVCGCLLGADIGTQLAGIQQYQLTKKNVLTCVQSFCMISTLSICSNVWVHVNLDVASSVNAKLAPTYKNMSSRDRLLNRATATLLIVHAVFNCICYIIPLIVAAVSTDNTAIDIVYAWCLNIWIMYVWVAICSSGFRSTYSAWLLRQSLIKLDTVNYNTTSLKSSPDTPQPDNVIDISQLNDTTLQSTIINESFVTSTSSPINHNQYLQYKRQSSEAMLVSAPTDTTRIAVQRTQSIPYFRITTKLSDQSPYTSSSTSTSINDHTSTTCKLSHPTSIQTTESDQHTPIPSCRLPTQSDDIRTLIGVPVLTDTPIASYRTIRDSFHQSRAASNGSVESRNNLVSRAETKRHQIRMSSVSKLTGALLVASLFLLPFLIILPILAYCEVVRQNTYILYNLLLITLLSYNISMNLLLQPAYNAHRRHTTYENHVHNNTDVDTHAIKPIARSTTLLSSATHRHTTVISPSSRNIAYTQQRVDSDMSPTYQHDTTTRSSDHILNCISTEHTVSSDTINSTAINTTQSNIDTSNVVTVQLNEVALEFVSNT